MNDITVSARIKEGDYEAIRQLAQRLDLKQAEIIRRCIRLGAEQMREVTLSKFTHSVPESFIAVRAG